MKDLSGSDDLFEVEFPAEKLQCNIIDLLLQPNELSTTCSHPQYTVEDTITKKYMATSEASAHDHIQ